MSTKKIESSLIKRLGRTNIEPLLKSIIMVQAEWKANRKEPGPNSDKYYMSTARYRPEMVQAVIKVWCKFTCLTDDLFPFNDDFVACAWMQYRKEGTKQKQALLKQLS